MKTTDVTDEFEDDFANLARLASSGAADDIRLFLARLVRRYRTTRPAFSARLDQSLKTTQTRASGPSIMRRTNAGMEAHGQLPLDQDSRLSLIRVFDDRDGIAAPILPADLARKIDDIVGERRQREKLARHGIRPSRSAILVGPPRRG